MNITGFSANFSNLLLDKSLSCLYTVGTLRDAGARKKSRKSAKNPRFIIPKCLAKINRAGIFVKKSNGKTTIKQRDF